MSTPLMKQYSSMKAKYPGTILLFRLGDFYETFEEDARVTSRVLGITLTKRGNGSANETPLAGFPYHALESYMPKLLKAGYRVAICEQMEDPKLAKGIVKRDVIEVVTPGVAFSDKLLDQKQNNYLCAVALPHALAAADDMVGLAFADVTTAEFRVAELPLRQVAEQIGSLAPAELLVQKRDGDAVALLLARTFTGATSAMDDWLFHRDYAYELLTRHFQTQSLKGFGVEDQTVGVVAAGAILQYLQETQKANLLHLKKLVPYTVSEYIHLDSSTKRNLEITRSMNDTADGTLFWVLDKTKTPMGGRLLKRWIHLPLRDVAPITERLEAVAELHGGTDLRARLGGILAGIGDMERLIAKICTNRANPRDIAALKTMLEAVGHTKAALRGAASPSLARLRDTLRVLDPVILAIGSTLADAPPLSLADGGVIRKGWNAELDELRDITVHGKGWIAALQKTEREATGISSLKIGFNNVFGYYIEITHTHKEKVPERYIRKQTLANAERFVTPELKEYEEKILHAEERILALETALFNDLRLAIAAEAAAIQDDALSIAALDCLASLAQAAAENNYVRPQVDEGDAIEIEEGRHPVIEQLLLPGESYTANDARLDTAKNQVVIITGPNMSGKSSYLRQVGLITLLAQIGSFVPARRARIGVVDRIYTRVGASDNIASGESTFLVEMHEAANIVNTATRRSLILLDEIGRGTSTFDGISIAWALTEYLHNRIGAKTLFATHYHELNELAELFPRIVNFKVDVREYGDKVVFLHKVTPGTADHSYGIQVAQMAGLPDELTARAKSILKNLEGADLSVHDGAPPGSAARRIAAPEAQMTLFELKDDALREEIKALDIEKMTPLEALQKLSELKKRL
jgi:DNA mismatch repair protein MutS